MTTIVAVETPDGVLFAADTQATSGHRAELGHRKVFANGTVVLGCAGAVRAADVLKFAELPSCPKDLKGAKLERWVVTELVPAVQKALSEAGALENDNGELHSNGAALVAVNGRLFEVGSDFSAIPSKQAVLGSGSSYALGALRAGATPKEAVQIASHYDVYTGAKVVEYREERLLA